MKITKGGETHPVVGAVILAAGQSQRMGQPKLCLPWGSTTVIGQVVRTLLAGGIADHILIVTGGAQQQIENALAELPVQTIYNPEYARSEMLRSLQIGIATHKQEVQASLVVLGDQPQIEPETVQALLMAYSATRAPLIVPSYQKRRGHPWLVARAFWPELLTLPATENLRGFLNQHAESIHYINLATPSILKDLDTPADYAREHPPDTG